MIKKSRDLNCINCGSEWQENTTKYFNGSISLFMPNASWVAKWNNLDKCKPGIYAIEVLEGYEEYEDYGEEDYEQQAPKSKRKKANKA